MNNLVKLVLIASSALTLQACGTVREIIAKPVALPPVTAPTAAPLVLRDTNWQILTAADIRALAADLEANPGKTITLYALDDDGFDALSLNLVDIRRYILEQQQIIRFFEGLEASNHPVEDSDK